jgi:hypothetical protein
MLFLFLLPFTIGYFYSIYRNPVLQNRVLIFSMPFFLIFIFSFFKEAKTNKQKAIVWIIPLAILLHTVIIDKYYSKQHFIDFRGIANNCANTHQTFNNKDIISIQHCNSKDYLQYYLQDTSIKFSIYEITTDNDLLKLRSILDSNTNKRYLEYVSTKPQNRIANMMITSLYSNMNVLDSNLFDNGYHLFEKSNTLNQMNFSKNAIRYDDYSMDTFNLYNVEYSKGIEFLVEQDAKLELKVSLEFRQEMPNKAMIAFEKVNIDNDKNKEWWAAPIKFFKTKEWSCIRFSYPIDAQKNDRINLYLWNPKKENIDIIKYKIGIFERIQ